jgi:uncharacterized protein
VKLVLREPGTDESHDLFSSAIRVFSSRLLVPETSAALSRAARSGRLGARSARRARELVRSLLGDVTPVEVSAALADRAWDLASELSLRGADAVHLASFEEVAAGDAVLVTTDAALVQAAAFRGHAVSALGN